MFKQISEHLQPKKKTINPIAAGAVGAVAAAAVTAYLSKPENRKKLNDTVSYVSGKAKETMNVFHSKAKKAKDEIEDSIQEKLPKNTPTKRIAV